MFPQYKEVIKNVGFIFRDYREIIVPDAWEDLDCVYSTCHTHCGRQVRIGKENEKEFWFCPRCRIKLEQKDTFHKDTVTYTSVPDIW